MCAYPFAPPNMDANTIHKMWFGVYSVHFWACNMICTEKQCFWTMHAFEKCAWKRTYLWNICIVMCLNRWNKMLAFKKFAQLQKYLYRCMKFHLYKLIPRRHKSERAPKSRSENYDKFEVYRLSYYPLRREIAPFAVHWPGFMPSNCIVYSGRPRYDNFQP